MRPAVVRRRGVAMPQIGPASRGGAHKPMVESTCCLPLDWDARLEHSMRCLACSMAPTGVGVDGGSLSENRSQVGLVAILVSVPSGQYAVAFLAGQVREEFPSAGPDQLSAIHGGLFAAMEALTSWAWRVMLYTRGSAGRPGNISSEPRPVT